ncbi:MAG: hypothetical protein JWO38_2601 [Gemmataceae bacterium]|nr:hypothetical protein [Gemmataceae bacterium]
MRNLLALVGALVIGFGGLGWYMGWYQIHIAKTPEGNIRVETDVDTKKVTQDSGTALKQVGTFVGEKMDQAGQTAQAGQQPTPGTTPGPAAPPTTNPQSRDTGLWLFGHDITPKTGK